jgi:hypothetical protein
MQTPSGAPSLRHGPLQQYVSPPQSESLLHVPRTGAHTLPAQISLA